MCHSERRGSAAHAMNMKVREAVVNAVNRWRKHFKSDNPSLPMHQHYSKLEALMPTLLDYSRAQ